MIDGIDFPSELDREESVCDIAIARDQGGYVAGYQDMVPPVCFSDDIDDVVEALQDAEARIDVAEKIDDWDALRRAERDHRLLRARLWELEEQAGWDEWRADRQNTPIW